MVADDGWRVAANSQEGFFPPPTTVTIQYVHSHHREIPIPAMPPLLGEEEEVWRLPLLEFRLA